MNENLVSVIICIYNGEQWLRRCLDSVAGQTWKELEIICVNDGSTDGTASILEEYAVRDSRFRIIHQENKGLGAARNEGIRQSTGAYVTGLDADDYLLPETYARCMAHRSEDVDIICYGIQCVSEKGDADLERQFNYTLPAEGKCAVTEEILQKTSVNFVNKLWHRRLVDGTGVQFAEGLRYEDNLFYFTAMVNARNIFYVQDKMYVRFLHAASIMGATLKQRTMNAFDHMMVIEKVYAYLQERGIVEQWKNAYLRFFSASYWFLTGKTPHQRADMGAKVVAYVARKQKLDRVLSEAPFIRKLMAEHWEIPAGECEFEDDGCSSPLWKANATIIRQNAYILKLKDDSVAAQTILTSVKKELAEAQDRLGKCLRALEESRILRLHLLMPTIRRRYRLLQFKKIFSFGQRRKKYKEQIRTLRSMVREYRTMVSRI